MAAKGAQGSSSSRLGDYDSFDQWAEGNPRDHEDLILTVLSEHPQGLTAQRLDELVYERWIEHLLAEMQDDGLVREVGGRYVLTAEGRARSAWRRSAGSQ